MRCTFESGPIRPPSEAKSLLLRCTRNCPWNKCAFCHTYKGEKFSFRTTDEIKADIARMKEIADSVREVSWRMGLAGAVTREVISAAARNPGERGEIFAVAGWLLEGPRSAFLQDADSLVMKTDELCDVLRFLRAQFPSIERVTTYARARTVAHKGVSDLKALREAGLDRIHIGMESGSDEVLKLVKKGVTAAGHAEAGGAVKAAGIELSEYWMPGLGGRALSKVHAVESAHVLNAVDPHFIRLRSIAIPPGTPLFDMWRSGEFIKPSDDEIVAEIRLFVEELDGIHSRIVSDHILNLLEEVEGVLPDDKPRILASIDRYLDLPPRDRVVFKLGRRTGRFRVLDDLTDAGARAGTEQLMDEMGVKDDQTLEEQMTTLMMRFI
ncbi:MAG: radical SAM protein [Deltaproteobacteria bacterium]|nr:radical SAM protein [Deltaproteobacteria bacterium]